MGGKHDHSQPRHPERYAGSMRVALVSVAANVFLTVAQIVIGLIGKSQALVADGFHTLSDLIADFLVLFAIKHGHKAADEDHPYGHERIETAVTMILGLILIVVGLGIAISAGVRLLQTRAFTVPSLITFWVALSTLVVKEGLYQFTMRTAKRFDSNMLRASAWHHRSDAISSLIVLIGIGGAIMGLAYLDSLAAIIVALMVTKIGGELAWQAVRELVDEGLSHEDLEAIRSAILSVSGVKALHLLRTRRAAEHAFADVHIIVDDRLSVSEGHQISEAVRGKLMKEFPISDVTVHIDIEEDAAETATEELPLRDEILQRLRTYFADIPQAQRIERMTLHYKEGHIVVELILPLSAARDSISAEALAERLSAATKNDLQIRSVSVLFH